MMKVTLFRGLIGLLTILFVAGLLFGQDLNQQKQQKVQEIREIDAKLRDNPTKQEYDQLIEQRKKLEGELKDIQARLMADAEALKKANSVKKAVNDALNAYKLGQYSTAVEHTDRAISLDSLFVRAYYIKGLSLKRMRKFNESIEAYKNAVKFNPAYTEAYVALAKMYTQIGQPDYAISTLESAIKNDPTSDKAYYELGAVYLNYKKNYAKAVQNFRQATQLDPEYDLAYYSLGVSLIEQNKPEQALAELEKALSVTKKRNWEEVHYRMAVAYNKLGKYSDAKASADKALAAKRNYAPAAYEAGKATKDLGQFNQAISYFQIAAKDRVWKRSAEYEIDLIQNRDKYN